MRDEIRYLFDVNSECIQLSVRDRTRVFVDQLTWVPLKKALLIVHKASRWKEKCTPEARRMAEYKRLWASTLCWETPTAIQQPTILVSSFILFFSATFKELPILTNNSGTWFYDHVLVIIFLEHWTGRASIFISSFIIKSNFADLI